MQLKQSELYILIGLFLAILIVGITIMIIISNINQEAILQAHAAATTRAIGR